MNISDVMNRHQRDNAMTKRKKYLNFPEILLICGPLSSLLYVAATIVGAMRWKGYSSTSQSVSELFAIDAPSKSLVDPLFVTYSVLWIAFGVGVWRSADRKRALRVAAAGLIGKEVEGLVVQLFFPVHLRGVKGTSNDPLHGVLTYLGVLFYLIAMGFGATAFGKRFRIYSIGTLLVGVVFGVLTGLDIPRMAANQPTPWMGVFERINIFSYLLWASVLAIVLLRAERSHDQFRLVATSNVDGGAASQHSTDLLHIPLQRGDNK